MKKFLILLSVLMIVFTASLFLLNLSQDEVKELIISGIILKMNSIALLFIASFSILRIRDWLLGTKFPIELINRDPKASAFYYGMSVFAFVIAIALIVS